MRRDVRFAPMSGHQAVSACPFRAIADIGSFDHFVSAGEHCRRNCEAECLSGFKIDDQFEFGRRLHRHITWLLSLEYTIDVFRGTSKQIDPIRAVGNQAAGGDVEAAAVSLSTPRAGPVTVAGAAATAVVKASVSITA